MEGNIYKYNIGTLKEEEVIHSVPASDLLALPPSEGSAYFANSDEVLVQSTEPGALIYKYL